ncbi:serine hydrolase domain-containing protein [Tenacibaculum ovolyticum]|uniref:serine hydrolase domain-containing protein n=1 Tax=Tenacibaculum ovolyticum TaxID=104270 RepID=UPI003BAB9CFF
MVYRLFVIFIFFTVLGCQSDELIKLDIPEEAFYFPPNNTTDWETTLPNKLNWNLNKLDELESFLINENTKSFMVLVEGKIVVEEYYNGHTVNDTWQWNSAGKTLVTATTGIAQQNGLIDIEDKVSKHLGDGWTNTTTQQENLIKIKNLLSMTSGLNDEPQLVVKSNLTYLANAGTRWAYANVFQRLMDIIEKTSTTDFDSYFNNELRNKIGMTGFWNNGFIYRIYNSDARSMARFGLLASQNGKWDGKQIVNENFFIESTTTSQNINPSYGYLWWLNGKNEYMLPSSQTKFTGKLVLNAPKDMIAAMGKNGQRIYIVPSKNIVIIRMGEATGSGNNFALSSFDTIFWEKFNEVVN